MPTFYDFGGGDGVEVIYALRNNSTFSNKILDELAASGQKEKLSTKASVKSYKRLLFYT